MVHIHNWQHAGNYPAFFLSGMCYIVNTWWRATCVTGMVDIAVHYLRLPHEISQVR